MSEPHASDNREAFDRMMRTIATVAGRRVPLDGPYELSPITPVGGHWYYSANCPACHERAAIVIDPSEGRFPVSFTGSGILHVECQVCAAHVAARGEDLRLARWP